MERAAMFSVEAIRRGFLAAVLLGFVAGFGYFAG